METHADKAARIFEEGYNCAQSVFCALCDRTGMERSAALRLSAALGGGMGRMREVCGAVSSILIAAGILWATDSPDASDKEDMYRLTQRMAAMFKEKHGTIICRELLNMTDDSPVPSGRTAEYYATRPCVRFVRDACNIFDTIDSERRGDGIGTEKTEL